MKYIDKLTEEQRAAMAPHAQKWIDIGWSTEPADWELFEDAIERCYKYADLPWHGNVVRVSSPIVLSLAGPIAAYILALRKGISSTIAIDGNIDTAIGRAVGVAVGHAARGAVDGIDDAVYRAVCHAVDNAVEAAVEDAVEAAVNDAISHVIGNTVTGAVNGVVNGAISRAIDAEVSYTVHHAVNGAISRAIDAEVSYTVHHMVDGAIGDAVYGAVGDAVARAVSRVVGDVVPGAVSLGVVEVVEDTVDNAINAAVEGAIEDAVSDAVKRLYAHVSDTLPSTIKQLHTYRLWGNLWTYSQARNSYYREVCGLELDGDMWDRAIAYEDTAKAAGWSWPHREFVMVCDRPRVLHLEQVAPTGWQSHRLHCEDGPAIAWADGYALYFWHGVHVPAELIAGTWTVADILREPNAEVRRCAIERMGWPQFVAEANLTQVGATVADPGNPGNTLTLYDLPEAIYEEPVRLLICTNGTVERDGTRRQFGLTVPAGVADPIEAAAWGYGLEPNQYAQLARRT